MVSKCNIVFLLIVFLSALSFTACKSEEKLISSDLMMIDDNEMVSSEVKTGKLSKTINIEAASFYPINADISPEQSGVILEEIMVKNLDYVHKGDLLAKVRAYTADEIAEKEAYIATKEADLNSKLAYYESEESRLNSLKALTQNSIEKSIYEQMIIENSLNRDYAVNSANNELDTLKNELEVINSVSGDCNIYAPFDGVIESVKINNEGSILSSSTVVFEMYSIDTVVVYFDDPGDVYYNNKVTVTAGTGDNKQVIDGVVMGADHYLSPVIRQGKVYVRLEGDYDKENLDSLMVELEINEAENVLITKSSGINKINDKSYVYIMEDGKLKRRHVLTADSDDENTWILQGIDEGDIVYLQ